MIERLKRKKDRIELDLMIAQERLHFGSPEEVTDRHDELHKYIVDLRGKIAACDRLIKSIRESQY